MTFWRRAVEVGLQLHQGELVGVLESDLGDIQLAGPGSLIALISSSVKSVFSRKPSFDPLPVLMRLQCVKRGLVACPIGASGCSRQGFRCGVVAAHRPVMKSNSVPTASGGPPTS